LALVRQLAVWCTPVALAGVVLAAIPGEARADEDIPRVTIRAEGVSLNYRDNPVRTGYGPLDQRLDLVSASGAEASVEARPWRVLGLEVGTAYVPFEIRETDFVHGLVTQPFIEKSRSRFIFRPISFGLGVHLPTGKRLDLYLGPTYSLVTYGGRNRFDEGDDLVRCRAHGATVGVDAGPRASHWAFTASARYLRAPLSGQLPGTPTYVDLTHSARSRRRLAPLRTTRAVLPRGNREPVSRKGCLPKPHHAR
jgi:hypothetical protein